ncbi:MFS transporter [Mesorhizobium sp. M4B.F.Ca.ET.215.01.1.1]|uniref:MFS transporter n=3 Tax=Mesorhizobium TaxID=68287 RepID=UPI000FD2DCF6|nr:MULTISPECIES: MFS transporter [unclassified Mesorhizobium]RUW25971.1 MFS transporter [Mesorhizobium sp. M4B.F.Ca.ET.013.02.1.1]TGQ11061.1 MFS transporter [Mesorhizobium sp. M4B.F.Ca.ET.215.01.1.1]TGQ38892.1 MFS transporter [Mesorhizobium sp. M4B.F.Ca.ET.214.01.1.1]TGQ44932.1 MFS transporter [Mesorhizobium sp. M00.F.Ca.ET.220.01.1.1]TGQ59990.1 MFS transporter [Mesorhizobium sp. M4B.F.Ca.ET.211.01.1.1]
MTTYAQAITRDNELGGGGATTAVAAMIAALFAGSTVLTPLYIIYKQAFGFSQMTLTLVYAVYVVGNLAALLVFGRLSDAIGRRPAALAAMTTALVSALVFLFAENVAWLDIARILSGLGIGVGAGTGTAWIAELIDSEDKSRAATIATSTNFVGLGLGALVSGVLAEYAPWPLKLTFVLYLALLALVTLLIWRTRETVLRPGRLSDVSMRPRLSVPADIRAAFVAPAVTGFGAMALVGFYAALAPSVLAQQLHVTNHAEAGALFFELSMVAAATILLTVRLSSRITMLAALALMTPTVALVVAAQVYASMAIMIAATGLCGVAAALGYRGGLQVVNQIAPDDRRAEVVSAFFICCFCGNALPVIGIGILSNWTSATAASLAFAGMITVFALVALGFGAKYAR